jgi:DnaJ-class molecular chaperone
VAKNYYTILGILPTATAEDIREAYSKRAKELHPDHYGENSSPFLEVQEAYNTLGNPDHRRNYDRRLHKSQLHATSLNPAQIETLRPGRSSVEPLRGQGTPVNLGEIYPESSFRTARPSIEEISDRLWGNFAPFESYKSERLQNLCLEIVLSPDEARQGGQMEIMLPSRTSCPTCGGEGSVGFYRCFRCMGNGALLEEVPVLVEFAPGISDGYQKAVSLQHLGIRDVYVTLLFRISGAG